MCRVQTDETVSHEGGRKRGMRKKKGKGMSSPNKERCEIVGTGRRRDWGKPRGVERRKRKQSM